MPEYFYTLDLGQTYGPKLEQHAAQARFDDIQAFAEMILCHALDLMERLDAAQNIDRDDDWEAEVLARPVPENPGSERDTDFDDGIPF
ncbi:MAG: hypothetical protein QNJ13_12525 [Paracoccaceae bacterium]|nr:hypothetical protein [Paracoccaceae bacterium]